MPSSRLPTSWRWCAAMPPARRSSSSYAAAPTPSGSRWSSAPCAANTASFGAESRVRAFARDHGTVDDLDRELLNAVQWDFPLEPRPFAALGDRLGIAEPEVRDRILAVKDEGVLRQLSAIFDTRALGYTSALVAAKIDPDHIDEAADIVSEHPGVSHNYKRNHDYNLWYTIAVPPNASLDAHIDVLHRDSGARVT